MRGRRRQTNHLQRKEEWKPVRRRGAGEQNGQARGSGVRETPEACIIQVPGKNCFRSDDHPNAQTGRPRALGGPQARNVRWSRDRACRIRSRIGADRSGKARQRDSGSTGRAARPAPGSGLLERVVTTCACRKSQLRLDEVDCAPNGCCPPTQAPLR